MASEALREYWRQKAQERRNAGLCVSCGNASEDATTRCGDCKRLRRKRPR